MTALEKVLKNNEIQSAITITTEIGFLHRIVAKIASDPLDSIKKFHSNSFSSKYQALLPFHSPFSHHDDVTYFFCD